MANIKLQSKKDKKNFKKTVIKDENGYYKVTLGAFNTFNKSGVYYRVKDINKILGENSLVGKRIHNGILISELGHPDVENVTQKELIKKTITLNPNNKVAHIKAIEIENTGKIEPGFKDPIYIIYGWIKPEGPKKQILEEALENPDENIFSSVRSIVETFRLRGILIKDVLIVSTWDYVYDGGYAIANQWYAAGLEEALCVDININNIKQVITGFEGMTCEDGKCILNMLENKKELQLEDIIFS